MKPLRVAIYLTTYTFGPMLPLAAQSPAETPRPVPPPPPPPPRPALALLHALDTDHNGILSAEELTHAPAALRTLDRNADGQLTPDEIGPASAPPLPPRVEPLAAEGLQPPPSAPRDEASGQPHPLRVHHIHQIRGRGPTAAAESRPRLERSLPLIAALDTDQDHVLSVAEIEAAATALRKLDRNGDGQITSDEWAPPPPPRHTFHYHLRHLPDKDAGPPPNLAPPAPLPAPPPPPTVPVEEAATE